MSLWPRPPDETSPPDLATIRREVEAFARGALAPWESHYLEFHGRRYQDTLRLLPEGRGRRLLDVGSFPGHLSVLAQRRGWDVTGLNHDVEFAHSWAVFLERCRERKIDVLTANVERELFPAPTASFDAVLFCELFEHLYTNPFHTLREIFRVLKPGGLLVLTTPNLRRAETLSRYLHGWGSQTPVSRPFFELLPSILYHRHNREYTAAELDYYLARQGKDLYDFRLEAVYHADCLDVDPDIPALLGQRAGRLENALIRLLRRAVPGTRAQLMARAWRSDATFVDWSALRGVEGFGPLLEDEQPVQGFTRRFCFAFRRPGPRAMLDVPLPPGPGPGLVSLMLAHLGGETAARTSWTLDGEPVMTLDLHPSLRPVRVRLFVPEALAAHGGARVGLEVHARSGVPGVAPSVGVGGAGLLAERLSTPAAIEAAIERTKVASDAEEAPRDGWWHAADSLYLPHRVTAARVDVGPGDEDHLGPGWYHRENWGRVGDIRWTGPEAVTYLRTDGRPTAVRLRVYTGDPRLGGVAGRLALAHAAPGAPFAPAGEVPFALAADTWTELEAPVPRRPGRLRVTIIVDAPRVPRTLAPDFLQDTRPLGLVLNRVQLA
jgi:SAM-dependent methyltransferase